MCVSVEIIRFKLCTHAKMLNGTCPRVLLNLCKISTWVQFQPNEILATHLWSNHKVYRKQLCVFTKWYMMFWYIQSERLVYNKSATALDFLLWCLVCVCGDLFAKQKLLLHSTYLKYSHYYRFSVVIPVAPINFSLMLFVIVFGVFVVVIVANRLWIKINTLIYLK